MKKNRKIRILDLCSIPTTVTVVVVSYVFSHSRVHVVAAVHFVDSRVSNWCDSSEHGVNARQRRMQTTAYKRGRVT